MKPAPFTYHAPQSLADTAQLLTKHDNAKVLAGGQSLVPMMNFRYLMPDHVIDLNGVAELAGITVEGDRLRIGAMTRQRDLEFSELITTRCPLMREGLSYVGHRQTRNRGTIGGSLAHADPAAELPVVCCAHDATVELASTRGNRSIQMAEFNVGFLETVIAPDEILSNIQIPLWPDGHGWAFQEFARRRGDFALAGVAVLLDLSSDQKVRRVSIALCGTSTTPIRLRAAEAELDGRTLTDAVVASAIATISKIEMIADIHSTAEYRMHLARVLVKRALAEAEKRTRMVPGVLSA